MKKKFLMIATILAFAGFSAKAQSEEGLMLYRLGEYDLAAQYFEKNIGQSPAEDNYYLGEIAYANDKLAEAKAYYEKSMASTPSVYGEIGLAKLELKNGNKEAKKTLEAISKKYKKENDVMLQVAKTFYDCGLDADGEKVLSQLMTAKNRDPYAFILKGEILQAKGEIGPAASEYDQAFMFDDKNIVALIKAGLVYERINPNTALENFKKALQIDPDNKMIMRFMAKTYTVNGRYPQAIALYNEYFSSEKFNSEDTQNFARALYFNGDYEKAKIILEKGLQVEPNNFVMNRLLMYTDDKLKDYEQGLQVANKFFALRDNKTGGYIGQDFITYGNILLATGAKEDALRQFSKAASLDPSNATIYKDLATELAASKLYLEAAEAMSKYILLIGDKATSIDYYSLGRYYLLASQGFVNDESDSAKTLRMELLMSANKAFSSVIELSPDSYLGYSSKADVNSLLDPDMKEDIAKDLYLKTLEVIQANGEMEKRKSVVMTAYQYLAVYYYYKYDDTKSKEMKEKTMEYANLYYDLNPNNTAINSIRDALK